MPAQLDKLRAILTPGLAASPNNFTPSGDSYFDKRKARIMTGEDQFEPSELEQRQMQDTRGTVETPTTTSIMSRDVMRDSGLHELRRKLRLEEIAADQALQQRVEPVRVQGQYGMQLERARAQNALAVAQEKSRGDIESARLKADAATRVASAKGGGAAPGGISGEYQATRASRVRQAIAQILPQINSGSAGFFGNLKHLPWPTDAGKLDGDLNWLKSNVIQSELQAMRSASKTGGALGQVSDFENRLLASALGNLDQVKQHPEQLKAALQQIDQMFEETWKRVEEENRRAGISTYADDDNEDYSSLVE